MEDINGLNSGRLLGWSLDFSGSWDPLDFGDYAISTVAGRVAPATGDNHVRASEVGALNVRIEDPSIIYVDTFSDSTGTGSLRDAILSANAAAPELRTIILDTGTYTIDIPPVADPTLAFPNPDRFCSAAENTTGWSNETTGDFDITGNVRLVGNQNDLSRINAQRLDRVFKVHPGAALDLSRVTVTGGASPPDQGGGGILSVGNIALHNAIVRDNVALSQTIDDPNRGGGIAAWAGTANLVQSWIASNESDYGGGVFFWRSIREDRSQHAER